MVSSKGKRKLEYNGTVYYWFVRKNAADIPRIHILSEDKRVNLEYPCMDSEVPVVPAYIRELLKGQ
ncbi:MAG: hypothetical protein NC305_00970 [Lachnospiraceae bacterium]|nr:hypothetical protein [Butyrivibrio sp.]MCM1344744.1 hypothetical protein [Muribaculaceae bacterium]MCM1409106.1 hypothetical protein [Lachnospiraceae bacterium]